MTTALDAGRVPKWTVGDRFRKGRIDLGLNQREMAERLGVTQKTVWAAESGASKPSRLLTKAWAMATGISSQWLATGVGTTEPPADGASAGGSACSQCAIRDSNPEPADLVHRLVRWAA